MLQKKVCREIKGREIMLSCRSRVSERVAFFASNERFATNRYHFEACQSCWAPSGPRNKQGRCMQKSGHRFWSSDMHSPTSRLSMQVRARIQEPLQGWINFLDLEEGPVFSTLSRFSPLERVEASPKFRGSEAVGEEHRGVRVFVFFSWL